MRRPLQILSVALITAGVVVLSDVALTLAWKEPLSSIYGSIQQGKAEDSLNELSDQFLHSPERAQALTARDAEHRAKRLATAFAAQAKTGQGIGRIKIPGIDLDMVVVQGADKASLQKGPGHYPETAFPGEGRTIGIAGHRTTYLAPFRHIDQIDEGDEITLEMPYGTFTYRVSMHRIVDPDDVQIVDDVGHERLVLTACHPVYSAAQRYAVFAELTDMKLPAANDGADRGSAGGGA
jgi:sortase A